MGGARVIPETVWRPTNAEYHEDNGCWSSTQFRTFLRSPALFRATYIDRVLEREETPEMALGSALHLRLFGGGEVIRSGALQRRGRAWEESVEQAGPNDAVLTAPAWDVLEQMESALISADSPAGELARALLVDRAGRSEWAYRWQGPAGLYCKVRVDRLVALANRPAIVELKSTRDPRPHRYQGACAEMRYDVQGALYQLGVEDALGLDEPPPGIHLAVGSSPPYDVAVYDLTEWCLAWGRRDLERAAAGIVRCLETGRWYASWQETPEGEVMRLDAPFWLRDALP
jgi:hypothetical protein